MPWDRGRLQVSQQCVVVVDLALHDQRLQQVGLGKEAGQAADLLHCCEGHPKADDHEPGPVQAVRDCNCLQAPEDRIAGADESDASADHPQRDVELEDVLHAESAGVEHRRAEADGIENQEDGRDDRPRGEVEALSQEAGRGGKPRPHVPWQEHARSEAHGEGREGLPRSAPEAAVLKDYSVQAYKLLRRQVRQHQGTSHDVPR
mmetsp:Transcript_29227/g.83945  ORF Transcript_29227/g.83945 Transcript_29227/m.83945 type:complete len:204 (+) Transcript_29227:1279-1890(+)